MGLHRSVAGLGRGARLFQSALEIGGIASIPWDVSGLFDDGQASAPKPSDIGGARTVIAHLNPVEHIQALALDKGPRPKKGFRVGYWAWETTEAPKTWIRGLDAIDEIWCPSVFTADAVKRLVRGARTVRVIPHPLVRDQRPTQNKARFGLASDKVTFFTAGDLHSSLARKNPLGAIEAFRRSGRGALGEAELLIKIHGGETSASFYALAAVAAQTPGVRLLTQRLSEADMAVLRSSVDVILSPHRSEGYGLVLAEAMQAGKPVIATGWSGNLDFMDDNCAALISAHEVPVIDPSGIYQGGVWAEPDLDHAAAHIQRLATDSQERARLGQAGAARIAAHSSLDIWLPLVKPLLGA